MGEKHAMSEKRPVGRPKGEASTIVNIRVPLSLLARLDREVTRRRSAASAARFLSALLPQMATAAPACASASAMPSPMPLLPPVIRATLPPRSNAG